MSTHTFSPVFGENIAIDKHSRQAKWEPRRSGGWVFSATPLEAGKEIIVTLNGSGHCDVGVIKTDPSRCDVTRDPAQFKKLSGIQIHKMRCCIPVSLNREGSEVTSKYQGEVFRKPVNKKTLVWITVYVKFGEVTAELIEETTGKLHIFSETHGTNIRLEEGKRKAVTINSNPAALCFVGQALWIGDTVKVGCEPLKVGSKKPSRFHVKLLVCRKNPESFHDDFRSAFDTSVSAISDPPVTVLEILQKEECDGTVYITLDQSSHVRYVSATNNQNNQNLNFDASNGVWVGFELYRVSISLMSSKNTQIGNLGFDQPDSRIREPQNENAEDSIQPFNSFVSRLQNQHRGNYITEERVDLIARNRTLSINNATSSYTATKLNVGHDIPVQDDIKDCQNHIYQNLDEKVTKPKVTNGYVQRQPDKGKVWETNHNFTTVPKAKTIPRPLQIPAPKTLSETKNSPSKTSFKHQNHKLQNTKAISETVSNPRNALTSLQSLTEESLIVSQLSRIERTMSKIEEKVSFGLSDQPSPHTADNILHRQTLRSDDKYSDSDDPTNAFIQKNWVLLVENVCADTLCDHLYQAYCIRDDQRRIITDLYKTDCQAANRQLLQLIKKRSIPASSLVKIFRDAEQGHLVDGLEQ